MKTILASSIAVALVYSASQAFAVEYSVFKVCQDQHVIHTSDGADAGHIEYIVVDPEQRQIVSTVIGGGVLGTRTVFVPYEDVTYSEGNAIVLNQITRERLVSAPVFEHTRIVGGGRLDPSYVQQSFTYYGGEGHRGGAVEGASVRAEGGADVRGVGAADNGGRPGGPDMKRDGTRNPADARDSGVGAGRPGLEAGRAETKSGRDVKDPGTHTGLDKKQNRSEAGAPTGAEPARTGTESGRTEPKAGRDSKEAGTRTGSEPKQNRSEAGAPTGAEPARTGTEAGRAEPKAARDVKDAGEHTGAEAKKKGSEAAGGESTEVGKKGASAGSEAAHGKGLTTPKSTDTATSPAH